MAGMVTKSSLKADISVTPLADIALVLVINMMLFLPPSDGGGSAVTLPQAAHSTTKRDTQTETVIAIDSRNHFYVNAHPVTPEDLVPRVQRALEDAKDKTVYVQGDKDARYSAIMRAMDALREGQIEDVALITEHPPTPGGNPAGRAR
jgi:biopolymer transport protein ExbD